MKARTSVVKRCYHFNEKAPMNEGGFGVTATLYQQESKESEELKLQGQDASCWLTIGDVTKTYILGRLRNIFITLSNDNN